MTESAVRKMIYRGKLQARRVGRVWSINRRSLDSLLFKRVGPLPDEVRTRFSTNLLTQASPPPSG